MGPKKVELRKSRSLRTFGMAPAIFFAEDHDGERDSPDQAVLQPSVIQQILREQTFPI